MSYYMQTSFNGACCCCCLSALWGRIRILIILSRMSAWASIVFKCRVTSKQRHLVLWELIRRVNSDPSLSTSTHVHQFSHHFGYDPRDYVCIWLIWSDKCENVTVYFVRCRIFVPNVTLKRLLTWFFIFMPINSCSKVSLSWELDEFKVGPRLLSNRSYKRAQTSTWGPRYSFYTSPTKFKEIQLCLFDGQTLKTFLLSWSNVESDKTGIFL